MNDRRRFFRNLVAAPLAVASFPAAPAPAPAAASSRRRVKIQISPVNGFQYYEGGRVLPRLRAGHPLALRRERFNRYDERAVAVYWRGRKLGYLPRTENTAIAGMMDDGEIFECFVTEVAPRNYPWRAVWARVEWVSV